MRQQFIPSKTARTKPWRLNVARCSLCADVIEYFSSSNAKMKLFQRTEVTFHDASGRPEDDPLVKQGKSNLAGLKRHVERKRQRQQQQRPPGEATGNEAKREL